jgi:hypothetical protein
MPPALLASQLSTLQVPDHIMFTNRKVLGTDLSRTTWRLEALPEDSGVVMGGLPGAERDDALLLRIVTAEGCCEFPDAQQCADLIVEALARQSGDERFWSKTRTTCLT